MKLFKKKKKEPFDYVYPEKFIKTLAATISDYSDELKETKEQVKIYEKIIKSLEEDRESLLNEIKLG